MRKIRTFSAVLSLFLLVPASITWAQTISSQKGLTTAVFPTQYGNVKVLLPDDVRPGDVISGTVVAEPKGNNARQIERNLVELVKYTVSIDGNKYAVGPEPETFKWLVHKDRQLTAPFELLHITGIKAHELTMQLRQAGNITPSHSGCVIPSHSLTDAPCRITGNFDGDMANTKCLLNNQPTQILAESPRQCIVQYPQNANGQKTMQVNENGQEKCTRQISGVNMQVTTGDLNLRKGQNTYIDVKLTGLQNLPDKAILTITNVTPNVVTMTNGNLQVIPVWPPADSAGGTFSVHCPAVSITTGNFVVNINLDLPEPGATPTQAKDLPPGYTSRSCNCGVTATVSKTGNSFTAVANPACTGVYGIGINTFCACTILSTTYKWSIKSGQENVELTGKTDGASVNVRPKSNGGYTVCVTVTTTCIDGTVCTVTTCADQSGKTEVPRTPTTPKIPDIPEIPVTDSIPTTDTFTTVGMVCLPDVKESGDPKMIGGLKNKQIGTGSSTIFRDEFIALEAMGSDNDLVKFLCIPPPPCPDTKSEKIILVAGKVRFEWEITSGEGRFVKLGCGSEDEKKDKGEHIVFQPPYVALPVKNADTTLTTTITLLIIDDGSPVTDETVPIFITIKTTRKKSVPDKYTVDITGGAADKAATPVLPVVEGTCKLVGPTWKPGDNLVVPVITLPGVADADKMVLGQWIVLKTQDQADSDPIGFNCVSANCTSSGSGKSYPDNIIWEWSIVSGGGQFILDKIGQYVIYQAPMEMPKGKNIIEVKIKLKVMNPGGERKDPDKNSEIFTLKIYQPGVKLSHPELTWLPEEDNSLELKSELMYKDGDWKPALAHMCRIHYFELMNVSAEKGVCLNTPIPKEADQCRDLQLKNENGHEAWDDAKASSTKCDTKELYQQARTQRPEKEYSITVHSRDFGAYGFLRSFANVNKKTSLEGKPVYISIPVKKTDVTHPQGRLKKTEYADNRVTIPHDIDENRIADGGWSATGGVMVPDPANNNEDEDDKPAGDGFKGDGLSTYEEYRGFKVMDGEGIAHVRTNHLKKDIFIRNESGLDLATYKKVSGLEVQLINEKQYVDDKTRIVNQNFNPVTHIVNQMGLRLVDRHRNGNLLGIAYSTTGQPTIPNQEIEIRIYGLKIAESCDAKKIKEKLAEKIAAVVAHELLHGNNVCHHGEQDASVENSFNLIHGLRSGNVSCVMRYDNVGTPIKDYDPEAIGSDLCSSPAGTGYNANGKFFQDAGSKRGNCKGQIRVSGKGSPPKSCGNR